MNESEKNNPDFKKIQNNQKHLSKIKNDFISFLLKEIGTHINNLHETGSELLNSNLSPVQSNLVDIIQNESAHSKILIEEILSFLDIDSAKLGIDEFQFDLKDYFDKRRNNNFPIDVAAKYPLNILFWEADPVNRRFAKTIFDRFGYKPDYELTLESGLYKEYDIVFIDLTNSKETLKEQSDIIFSYFSGKKHPQIVALTSSDFHPDKKDYFESSVDQNLIKPVKLKELFEVIEKAGKRSKTQIAKPVNKFRQNYGNKKFIEEDKISFIQEIQSEEDIVFFIELIDIFIVETPKVFKIVREAVKNEDYEKIHFGGHKLRGSSLTMGVEIFIEMGSRLEKDARDHNLEDADIVVAELEHIFIVVVEELEGIKDNYRAKYLSDIN